VENPRLAIMKVMKRISLENVRDNKKRNDRDLTSKTVLCSSAIILESARIKRWGKVWYTVGIAGTVILIGLWVITRIEDNPITGRGGPISERAIAVEVFQIAYVAITALIMAKERIRKPSSIEEKR
jgi:hypothetical protein